MSAPQEFVSHMIRRIQEDGRVGYYIGPASRSLELLIAAGAEMSGETAGAFGAKLNPLIRTERPRCRNCACPDCDPEQAHRVDGDGLRRHSETQL